LKRHRGDRGVDADEVREHVISVPSAITRFA
jgi:hypothetical protein